MEQRKKRAAEKVESSEHVASLEQHEEIVKSTRKRGRTAVRKAGEAETSTAVPGEQEHVEADNMPEEYELDESDILDEEEVIEESEEEPEEYTDEDRKEAKRLRQEQAEVIAGTDSVRAYLKNIGKVALLDAEQEVDMAKAIEAGLYARHLLDKAAENGEKIPVVRRRNLMQVARDGEREKDHMLEANLRLVVSIAKRYTGRGMSFLDLIQEGNLGLIRAVQKFDYAKGYKFSTYATWWIRQSVTRGLADQARTIRIPVHMVEVINKMGRIQRELLQDLGRPATDEELSKEMGIELDKLAEIKRYAKEPISLNMEVGNEDGRAELGEFIEDADARDVFDEISTGLLNDQIETVLATLTEREANIIRLRFGLTDGQPRTLDEIGGVYNVSRERVRQIERDTMVKLRQPSRAQVLQNLLTVEDDR